MALKDFENKTLRRRKTAKRIRRFLTAHPKVLRNILILTAVLAAFINGLLTMGIRSFTAGVDTSFHLLRIFAYGTLYSGAFPRFLIFWLMFSVLVTYHGVQYLCSIEKIDDRDFVVADTGEFGTSHFMDATEQQKILKLNDEVEEVWGDILGIDPDTGKYIEINPNLPPEEQIAKHTFVCGSSGMRKSRSIVIPWIMQYIKRNESYICTDPKGEMYAKTSELARAAGYDVKVFNLVETLNSDSCNFLSIIGNDTMMAQSMAEVLIANSQTNTAEAGESVFVRGERAAITMGILVVAMDKKIPAEQKTLASVYEFLVDNTPEEIAEFVASLPQGHPARQQWNIFQTTPEKLQGSIFTGLATRLQLLSDPKIQQITSYDEIDLCAPGQRKCAYYVIISDQEDTLNYFSAMFFSFLFIQLVHYADKRLTQRVEVPVNIMLDEFPNIGAIPGFTKKLNTIRSRDISCTVVTQDLGQLMDRYRGHVWESIISACDRQILLGLNEHKTNGEWWAEKTGYITIEIGTERRNGGGLLDMEILNDEGLMSSTGVGRRLLMLPDEIQSMGRNFALLFINGYHVKKVRKFDYMDHPMAKEIKETSPYRHQPAWWKSVEKESWFVIQRKELTKQWEAQEAEKVAQKKEPRDAEPSPQPDEFEQFQKIFRTALVHGELKPLFKELKAYFIALYHFTRGFFEGKTGEVESASAPAEVVCNEAEVEPSKADTTEAILEEILIEDEDAASVEKEPPAEEKEAEPSDDDFFIDCREKGSKTLVKSKKL